MTCTQRRTRDPSPASSRIENATVELMVGATLLVTSASMIAASIGNPELMALVACVGIAVTLLGPAIVSASHGSPANDSTDRSPRENPLEVGSPTRPL